MTTLYPFIKWVGGKSQIIDEVFKYFPKKITNYYEPFIGGGSVLLQLINKIEQKEITVDNILIGDFNKDLIDLYSSIKDKLDDLLIYLNKFKENYHNAPINENTDEKRKKIIPEKKIKDNIAKSKEHVYYFYRKMFNKLKKSNNKPIKKSALFIFLNKTSFRGVYRENSSGEFNVPFGNYKNMEMFDENNLKNCSSLFKKYKVNFNHINFYDWKEKIKYDNKTFIYLDPPYFPENETSFTSYTANDFNLEQHKNLINFCKHINTKKSKFLLSNSDTSFIKNGLKEFKIQIINLKRQINSKNPGATTNEVLICN